MKKILRGLYSGLFLFGFIMLIEILALIFVQFFMDNVIDLVWPQEETNVRLIVFLIWAAIRIVGFIASIIVFFRILNRSEAPEFKIPWLVGIFLLPLFTLMMFIIFGNHGLSFREKRVVQLSRSVYTPYLKMQRAINGDNEIDEGHAFGAFNYLKEVTGLGAHSHNRVVYYKTGEDFFPAFIDAIKEAKEFIFIEFFIITDGKEWDEVKEILIEKAKQGVEVRLVYDDLGCAGTISPRTPKKLGKYGIKCYKFHKFRLFLHGSYNNRDHRKIVIVDHKYGFTGGINLADEYANVIERFGYWKDTMVRIEGSAISNLIMTFLQNYDLCAREPSDYNKYLDHVYETYDEPGYICPFGDGPGGIDDALVGEQNYVNILNYAQKRIDISTPYLVPTYGLLEALRNAALRGVEVNIILPKIPDKKIVYLVAKSHFRVLLDAGAHIYYYTPGFNHMKTCLADDKLAFVGTVNFDFRSLVHHFECGATLYKCSCISDIRDDFDQMLSVSERVPDNFKLNRGGRFFCAILKLFFPLL